MFIQWQPEEKKKGKNNFLKHNPASRCESGVFIQRRIGKIVIGTTWSTTLTMKNSKVSRNKYRGRFCLFVAIEIRGNFPHF